MNASPVRLLLVEDNPMDARFVMEMLASVEADGPLECERCNTAGDGVRRAGERQYQLMLLDYQLPDATGLDVLAQIGKLPATEQPAVIMLTASGNEEIAVAAMKSGAMDYLRKDRLDLPALRHAIKSALSRKTMQDEIDRCHALGEEDMRMAREMQTALLPQSFPVFPPGQPPATSALAFASLYLPSASLGGDFFEVVRLDDQVAGLLICDVMGHGVRSALVTAMVRALFEELRPFYADPAALLSQLNRGLSGVLRQAGVLVFATAFYATVDARHGRLHYASAGHPAPLRLMPGNGVPACLDLSGKVGPALAILPDADYAGESATLEVGDRLLLFTDGLHEAGDPTGQPFGLEQVANLLCDTASQPLRQQLDQLIAAVHRHAGRDSLDDDLCILGLERRPWPIPEPPTSSRREP